MPASPGRMMPWVGGVVWGGVQGRALILRHVEERVLDWLDACKQNVLCVFRHKLEI